MTEKLVYNEDSEGMQGSNGGFTLLSTLSLLLVAAMIVGYISTIADLYASITTLHVKADQVFWLSRSQAIQVLRDLESGAVLPSTGYWSLDGNKTVVEVINKQGTIVEVTVTSHVDQATITVEFKYDTDRRQVVNWVDNYVTPSG